MNMDRLITWCNLRALIAATLASGVTYAGVAATTPAAPPAPVVATAPAPAVNPDCPAQPAGQLPLQPGAGCDYYTDVKAAVGVFQSGHLAGQPAIVSNTVPNMLNLCEAIKSQGAGPAATGLYNAWLGQPTPLTMDQAAIYVRINQQDVTCR